jgi:hypothetical protein
MGERVSGTIYKRHVKGSIKAPDVMAGLQQIRRQLQRPFILIWDRSRVHGLFKPILLSILTS